MGCLGAGFSSHSSQESSFLPLLLEPLLVLAALDVEDVTSEGAGTVKGLPSTSALNLSLYICRHRCC